MLCYQKKYLMTYISVLKLKRSLQVFLFLTRNKHLKVESTNSFRESIFKEKGVNLVLCVD